MPEIRWLTPIYHPNISEIGMVCLGGYGTHWVPSLNLDELCGMLWDMARYHNYDIRSPYNREAALWVANQTTFRFPIDARPLRDLRAALGPGRDRARPIAAEPPPRRRPARAEARTADASVRTPGRASSTPARPATRARRSIRPGSEPDASRSPAETGRLDPRAERSLTGR